MNLRKLVCVVVVGLAFVANTAVLLIGLNKPVRLVLTNILALFISGISVGILIMWRTPQE